MSGPSRSHTSNRAVAPRPSVRPRPTARPCEIAAASAAARVLPAAVACAIACAATPPGASDANLAQAKSRAAPGSQIFERACATCHGPRGEGLAGAPSIVGVTALPRYPRDQSGVQLYQDPNQVQRQNQQRVPGVASRIEFVTAQDLYDFLRQHMSLVKRPALMTSDLSESDTWAVVNFVLVAHGSEVPATGISPDNARGVPIRSE